MAAMLGLNDAYNMAAMLLLQDSNDAHTLAVILLHQDSMMLIPWQLC